MLPHFAGRLVPNCGHGMTACAMIFAMSTMERQKLPLDGTDRRMLAILQEEGRISNAALAERLHLSPSPCLRRMRTLEQDGVVAGYRAVLDRAALGLGLTVFVELKVEGHSRRSADSIAD